MAPYEEELEAIRHAVELTASALEDEVGLPEVVADEGTPDDEEWLYDSRREYLDQLDYYKRHQARPTENTREKACKTCGKIFIAARRTGMYCSRACNNQAKRARRQT
jgi:hypothetical protein